MDNKACLICGAELEYSVTQNKEKCAICGREFYTNAKCENGHFVCDECHRKRAVEGIVSICNGEKSNDPIEILEKLMDNPYVHMHGPEHHILPGAALITAYCNSNIDVDIPLEEALHEIIVRGKVIPGGSCGFLGICGAAASGGAFVSIITQTTPMGRENWKILGQTISKVIGAIADLGGPRCCKRVSFVTITTIAEFVKYHMGVKMNMPETIKCKYHNQNKECLMGGCPFYPLENISETVAL